MAQNNINLFSSYKSYCESLPVQLAPTMDLDYDLSCSFHTPEILRRKIELLAQAGFQRLYIVAPPPGAPDYSHAARELPVDGPPNFLRQSRQTFPDSPLEFAVTMAKDFGLEVIIVFKPYEGGGAFTIPHGKLPENGRNFLEVLGGRAVGLDPFIVKHPEYLISRRPTAQSAEGTITKLEIVFVAEKNITNFQAIEKAALASLEIYTSDDNGHYEKYRRNFKATVSYEHRLPLSPNGEKLFPSEILCKIVEIKDLEIKEPYFAVLFEEEEKGRSIIPHCMCTAFSEDRLLPITVSPTVREIPGKTHSDFTNAGFEFEELGPYYFDRGWRNCSLFGFAKGKLSRLRGGLCEAYPEVRDYWLGLIRKYLNMGCDGIDIRLKSHCTGITDFVNYGFNPPLVEACRKKLGINILEDDFDFMALAKVRGEFFTEFVCAAAEIVHDNGKLLSIQLQSHMDTPSLDPTFHEFGFWANPKVLPDWKILVDTSDEVMLKDYNFGSYDSEKSSRIKDYALEHGKPLWIHCYLQQGNDWNRAFMDAVLEDKRINGINLYEVVWNKRENNGIIKVDENGRVEWVFNAP